MATISRLRAFWEPLAVKNACMLLKKRVDVCTSRELEHAVVQYRKAKPTILSATHCIEEDLIYDGHYDASTLVLAPGGRWLLKKTAVFKYGVMYVDLDDPDHRWRQLIPPGPEEAFRSWMTMDGEYDSSHPSFHVSLELVVPEDGLSVSVLLPDPERRISVWKISPSFDFKGVIDGLTAELKFLYRIPSTTWDYQTVNLQGPHLLISQRLICWVIKWVDVELGAGSFPWKTIFSPGCAVSTFNIPHSPS